LKQFIAFTFVTTNSCIGLQFVNLTINLQERQLMLNLLGCIKYVVQQFGTIDNKVLCACACFFPPLNLMYIQGIQLFLEIKNYKWWWIYQNNILNAWNAFDLLQVGAIISLVYVSFVPIMSMGCLFVLNVVIIAKVMWFYTIYDTKCSLL
jgi:hypothetical protein